MAKHSAPDRDGILEIERAELLRAVETAKPALAARDLIEQLLYFWFDGETVTAYNDAALGIQVPLKCGLRGGMRGSLLLGMLSNSRAPKITVEPLEKGQALLTVGKGTKLKLTLLPLDDAVHKVPDIGGSRAAKLSEQFFEGLKAVMTSISAGALLPDHMGVSVVERGGKLHLYSTDAKTMSHFVVGDMRGWPLKSNQRVILPTAFVECLSALGDDKTTLSVSSDDVVAKTGAGVVLFGRLVESQKPVDFDGVMERAADGVDMVDMPNKLRLMLERAAVMLEGKQDQVVEVRLDSKELRVAASTYFGDLVDKAEVEGVKKELTLRMNPDFVKRAYPLCDKIGLGKEAMILEGPRFTYVAASY